MKTGFVLAIVGGLMLGGCDRRDKPAAGPEVEAVVRPGSDSELVAAFVSAVNTRDLNSLRSLIHPGCLAVVTDENRSFFDDLFAHELGRGIPGNFKMSVSAVAADSVLPFGQMLTFPVRPTHTVQLDFEETPVKETTMVRWAAVEDGTWWLVVPAPTAAALEKMREKEAKEAEEAEAGAEG